MENYLTKIVECIKQHPVNLSTGVVCSSLCWNDQSWVVSQDISVLLLLPHSSRK